MIDKNFVVTIFLLLAKPIAAGNAKMKRRSSTDKEYFVQDWVEEQLHGHFQIYRQGRNSHPDYILTSSSISQGLEVKSLECRRKDKDLKIAPCRTDVDFNSCIPCGFIKFREKKLKCYYAFILYESDAKSSLHVKGVSIAFVDGDAFIRTRKMYRFPNPLTHPQFRYQNVLVTEFCLENPSRFGLRLLSTVQKKDKTGKVLPFSVYTPA